MKIKHKCIKHEHKRSGPENEEWSEKLNLKDGLKVEVVNQLMLLLIVYGCKSALT